MINLEKDCEFVVLSEYQYISDFDCGNADLNEFFNHDALRTDIKCFLKLAFTVI